MTLNTEKNINYKVENKQNSHDRIIEFTKKSYINILNNPEIQKLIAIKTFLEKYPELLTNFISNNEEIVNIDNGNIQLKKSVEKYIDEFLMELNINIQIDTKYENIVDENGCIQCMESLLRIKDKDKLNHVDFLEIHNSLGKSFYIFLRIVHKVFKDIKEKKINGSISINAEVSDIENNNFITTLLLLKNKYGIDFNKNPICIEILENQDIPNTLSFKNKIKSLKDIGIKIALDDLFFEEDKLENTIESIKILGESLDAVKLDCLDSITNCTI